MSERKNNPAFVASCSTAEIINAFGPLETKKRRGGLTGLGKIYTKGGLRIQIGGPKTLILRNGGV